MSFKTTPILLLVLLFSIGLQKAWAINAEVTYYHNDLLGSPVAATNEAGEVIWREDYNPFGEKREAPLENANDVGFTGHQTDDDVGLTYMQARYYDPQVGRFYGVDPVGFTGGIDTFNRYAYVANNPFKYLDPTGMSKEDSKRTVRDLKKQEQKCSEGWRCYSSGHQSLYDQGGNAQKEVDLGNTTSIASIGLAGADIANTVGMCQAGVCFGQWQGVNGKWYNLGWGGNQWTGARRFALFNTQSFRLVGKGLTVTSAGVELIEMGVAVNNRSAIGVADSALDLTMMAPTVLGGPVGFGLGIGYTAIDNTIGFDTFSEPVTDLLCSVTGDC